MYAANCARGAGEVRCSAAPCVYLYDLPSRMNVLGMKAEWSSDWWEDRERGLVGFSYNMPYLVHEMLLESTSGP